MTGPNWPRYEAETGCPHLHINRWFAPNDNAPPKPKMKHMHLALIKCSDCDETLWEVNRLNPCEITPVKLS